MGRALRLVVVALVMATAGLTVAQPPPATSPAPASPAPASPTPTTPATPNTAPSPMTPTPVPAPTDAAQTIPPGPSLWRSQDGSVADITIDSTTGTLTGTFTPGFSCGLSTTLTTPARPLVGTVSGNAVAWTLGLSACPSVGTWIGHYQTTDTEEQLAMLWTIAVTESPPGVGSILTGSALFVRQTAR